MISNKFLYNILEIQEKHPNLYIGGSISLILQNLISREPSDIDWVSPNKTHILDIFNIEGERYKRRRNLTCNGIRNELFINKNAQYLEYNYNGYILKISPIEEIFEWKYKFQKHAPNNIKNNNDIINYEKTK